MKVTNDNFGDLLIASVKEALEIAHGEKPPARVRRYGKREDGTWELINEK